MSNKRPGRTDQQWLDLIRECRNSGQTDKDWCHEHRISPSNFYYHIRRLRKKAYPIPEASLSGKISLQQDVVPVEIREEAAVSIPEITVDPLSRVPGSSAASAVRIRFRDIQLEILNGADSKVIRDTLSAVGVLC